MRAFYEESFPGSASYCGLSIDNDHHCFVGVIIVVVVMMVMVLRYRGIAAVQTRYSEQHQTRHHDNETVNDEGGIV